MTDLTEKNRLKYKSESVQTRKSINHFETPTVEEISLDTKHSTNFIRVESKQNAYASTCCCVSIGPLSGFDAFNFSCTGPRWVFLAPCGLWCAMVVSVY